ncbi:MAG: helix-hairpin-helix domain-containing protein [Promethearchaeota archaeon]
MSSNVSTNPEEIHTLRDQLNSLKQKKDQFLMEIRRLEAERKKFKEERDLHNSKAAELFASVNELKKRRDTTNTEIREMKQIRQDVLAEMKLLIEKAQNLRQDLQEIRQETATAPKKKGPSSRRLRRHIEDLEWKIQTTPSMDITEEREIMSQVEELASQLEEKTASQNVKRELSKINADIENLKRYLDETWRNFNDLVSSSQEQHKRLTELYEQGKTEKEDADLNHKLFVQRSQQLRELRQEFVKTRKELQRVYKEFKEKSEAHREFRREARRERRARVIDARVQEILDKKEKQKSLTFEEMRILMDHNLLNIGGKPDTDSDKKEERDAIEAEKEPKIITEEELEVTTEAEEELEVTTEAEEELEVTTEAEEELEVTTEEELRVTTEIEKEPEITAEKVEEEHDLTIIPRLGKSTKEKLEKVGISSIDDLVKADPKELAEKLGKGISEKIVITWIEGGKEILQK